MWHWARASALGDANLPFSFKDMGANAGVAHDLVGAKAWKAFEVAEKAGVSRARLQASA